MAREPARARTTADVQTLRGLEARARLSGASTGETHSRPCTRYAGARSVGWIRGRDPAHKGWSREADAETVDGKTGKDTTWNAVAGWGCATTEGRARAVPGRCSAADRDSASSCQENETIPSRSSGAATRVCNRKWPNWEAAFSSMVTPPTRLSPSSKTAKWSFTGGLERVSIQPVK